MIYNEMLSKSKIKTYETCPYKFKKIYIHKLFLPKTSVELNRGKELHEIFEAISNNQINEENIPSKYKNIVDMFRQFNELFSRDLVIEKMLEDDKREIHGVIDRVSVTKEGEKVILIDYKSGGIHNIEDYRFELALYTYLFEHNYDLKIDAWGIYFTDWGKFIYEEVNEDEIDKALSYAEEIREEIEFENFPKTPNKFCNWCELRINNHCKGDDGKGDDGEVYEV